MKVLNLYAGIGGNRKLWGGVEVTAVEYDPTIAGIYKDFFPEDTMIVGDAHAYLLEHYKEFDFIWSSPPCPTHSRLRFMNSIKIFPDMKLYEEIIFLKHWFKGLWCVENVTPYYQPLIEPSIIIARHCFWSNFQIKNAKFEKLKTCKIKDERVFLEEKFNFDLEKFQGIDKRKVLRNCVNPKLGLHIFNNAININSSKQMELF
jgi:DNA (cytosine-5)-methyltransferase 1